MAHLNFEFKARINNLAAMEEKLLSLQPVFKGEDQQCDTYFNVSKGRLKLREGSIENALIYYEREDSAGSKQSNIVLYRHQPEAVLKEILTATNGIKVTVNKVRRIYFVDIVKFLFDTIAGLGHFIEVEAIDTDGTLGLHYIKQQCEEYAAFFNVQPQDYIAASYSDMIIDHSNTPLPYQ